LTSRDGGDFPEKPAARLIILPIYTNKNVEIIFMQKKLENSFARGLALRYNRRKSDKQCAQRRDSFKRRALYRPLVQIYLHSPAKFPLSVG
jgi:hypothetical protein